MLLGLYSFWLFYITRSFSKETTRPISIYLFDFSVNVNIDLIEKQKKVFCFFTWHLVHILLEKIIISSCLHLPCTADISVWRVALVELRITLVYKRLKEFFTFLNWQCFHKSIGFCHIFLCPLFIQLLNPSNPSSRFGL